VELTFSMEFDEEFDGGTFHSDVKVLDFPLESGEGDMCSGGTIKFPQDTGTATWEAGLCPAKKGKHDMKVSVNLKEDIPTLLDTLTMDWKMLDKNGNEKACAHLETATLGCSHFFGDMMGFITIADPDIGLTELTKDYCDQYNQKSPCTYVHYAGETTLFQHPHCEVPAPVDGSGCHHYVKVTYNDSCKEIHDNPPKSGDIDVEFRFDHHGVLTSCKDYVVSQECYGWGPPADAPVQCDCGNGAKHGAKLVV